MNASVLREKAIAAVCQLRVVVLHLCSGSAGDGAATVSASISRYKRLKKIFVAMYEELKMIH